MQDVTQPLQLGSLLLPNRVFYSPLAGCSDVAFRKMSAKYGPGLMFCEMVKMEPLVRMDPKTLAMLGFTDEMSPIGAQACGSNPKIAGAAAKIIEDRGFDLIDFNCGCPVDKVTKDGSGSGMLKNPEKIGEIIANMVAAVKIPVTVKVRAGWDEMQINAPLITQIVEKAGAKAITVHGRTREQGYRGPANWDYIKACKQAAKEIQVIGNGDIFDADAAKRMTEYTGCDAIMVSRGTMGKPWIAEDILRSFSGMELEFRGAKESKEALLEHFGYTVNYRTEHYAMLDMRRVGCWYIKDAAGAREFRGKISMAKDLQEIETLIKKL